MKVLVVEDSPGISSLVVRALREAGYLADCVADSDAAMEALELEVTDLLVLDVMIPGTLGNGMDLCRLIRSRGYDIPVLMLTALDSLGRKVEGLDAGADDYLVKPFHVAELLARVRALLRRPPVTQPAILCVGPLALDPATRTASRGGRLIDLTPKEFAVLEYLMRNPNRVVSASELIEHAWDNDYDGTSNVVPSYIRYLRQKLALSGEIDLIETRRGAGYVLQESADVS